MKMKQFILALVLSAWCLGVLAQADKKDFEVKGFHLDLRIQVMKPEALKAFAKELSDFGVNTLVMEWEGSFPFESHPLIANKNSYTKAEIRDFVSYCESLGIDVIPLQQTLGHMEYVLRYARYAKQREDRKDVSQICPSQPKLNKALLTDLITEMAELHPSKYFHIGGDEAYLFGHCKHCSAKVEEHGKAKLLAEHLKMVCDIVVSLGKVPVLWADVANKYPEELHQLPKETVFVVWNYGWALDRFGDPAKLVDLGFEVWGAPSLRSNPDNYYLTRWNYHLENNRDFIPLCRESGYNGILMTSWSTSGIYSAIFEDKQTIIDLIALRNVYPISGFRILLAAYAQSMNSSVALDIEKFIAGYCDERFGFTESQSAEFWIALQGAPYEVIDARVDKQKDLTVEHMWEGAQQNQTTMHTLKPKTNKEEFAHFVLMNDIRENYLAFKVVEARVNHPGFTLAEREEVLEDIETILAKDRKISKQFCRLNKDLLYKSDIEVENTLRTKRVLLLKRQLEKERK